MAKDDGSELLYQMVMQKIGEFEETLKGVDAKVGDHEKAASGMVTAVMAMVDQHIEAKMREFVKTEFAMLVKQEALATVRDEIAKYKAEDRAEDRREIAIAIERAMNREETIEKRGTVETPDGIHKMTVVETRKRK